MESGEFQDTPAGVASESRRIVVKVGSALLVSRGRVRRSWLRGLAADIAALRDRGCEVTLVSSGAVGLGRDVIAATGDKLAERQAAAAAGQVRLAEAYRRALGQAGLSAAQVLLSPGDTEDRRRHLNARATLATLLARGAVPVINENDTVATDELKFGDNDRLAARVAQLVSADLVVLLSDVDGLYEGDPRRTAQARHIARIERITPELEAMARGPSGELGQGGMAAKLAAAKIAMGAGAHLAIADGRAPGALGAFFAGARASWFVPESEPMTARKAWIAATVAPKGKLIADSGAIEAVLAGSSLLAVGVRGIEGDFARGDPVRLVSETGDEAGIGLINYDAGEAVAIRGRRSEDIPEQLGYRGPSALIHRDNLALTGLRADAKARTA